MVQHQRVGRLLGVQLELLGQLDADPLRLEQVDQLRAVLEVGAGAVAEREPRAAVASGRSSPRCASGSSPAKPSSARIRLCQYSASDSVSCTDSPCSSR